MIRHQLFIGFALIAGVAIGYFVRDDGTSADVGKPAKVEGRERARPISDGGDAATIRSLRRRVAELERRIAEMSAAGVATDAVAVVSQRQSGGRREGFRERLERMKESDPAQYAQMTNRMARWRQERAARVRTTMEFLSSVDTSKMSAAARKTHADLQNMIARREEIEEGLRREDLTDEQRQRLFGEMREAHREIARLNGEERANLISETAKSLGFDDEDANVITATIQEVIDATSGGFGHRGGPPPPPPPNRGG